MQRLSDGPFLAGNPLTADSRHLRLGRMLDWLASQPGQTWQERWQASGAEQAGRQWPQLPAAWLRDTGHLQVKDPALSSGMMLLLCGQVIRPSYDWLTRQRPSRTWIEAQRILDPGGFERLAAHHDATRAGNQRAQRDALIRILWIILHKGGQVADITVGDCVELDRFVDTSKRHKGRGTGLYYLLLRETRTLPATSPPTLRAATMPGQLSVVELVSTHGIECAAVRGLLVDYLSELRPSLDYGSLLSRCHTLCRLFWRDLEIHHPGICSLHLAPDVAEAWKQRLRLIYDANGNPVRDRTRAEQHLLTVRSFYRDVASLAAEDPARWGQWAVPCPIRANECADRKARARGKAAMDQRTRRLLPNVAALSAAAEQHLASCHALISAACRTAPGDRVAAGDRHLIRRDSLHSNRIFAAEAVTGKRVDLTTAEERAFWAFAAIEVLRQTGMRIEEMLELTHHSFLAYKLPTTGEIVPMLQVAPSKTDAERLLLIAPELGETLTGIIYRVRDGQTALPLVSAYDGLERTWSAPMPYLFQRRFGGEHRALGPGYIRGCINDAVTASGLADASGEPLRFTPHDFRRILSALFPCRDSRHQWASGPAACAVRLLLPRCRLSRNHVRRVSLRQRRPTATRVPPNTASAERRRIFVTDAIMSGLPPHIAQVICGHKNIDTTIGYKNSRELHQLGEKSQVSRSQWGRNSVLRLRMAAV